MKIATGLTLIAIGAVLAFAVNGHPWFLNLQITGWIIMAVGVAGLVIPRSGYGWIRRQMVVRPGGRQVVGVQQGRNPSYIMINPAAAAEPEAGEHSSLTPGVPEYAESGDYVETTTTVVPDEEAVEEYFKE